MKKQIALFLLILPLVAGAQKLKSTGTSVEDIVPKGWTHTEQTGDLNKDGIKDLVIIATPDFKENTKTRDDGYVYNFNKPVLAIYFGSKNGDFQLFSQYKEVLAAPEHEFVSIDYGLNITDKGVLTIDLSYFYSAGSGSNDSDKYVFRYQNGDFFLIGKDEQSQSRMSGEFVIHSYNYLTNKLQIVTDNVFEDNFEKKEKWQRIPKKPLQKLGSFEME